MIKNRNIEKTTVFICTGDISTLHFDVSFGMHYDPPLSSILYGTTLYTIEHRIAPFSRLLQALHLGTSDQGDSIYNALLLNAVLTQKLHEG